MIRLALGLTLFTFAFPALGARIEMRVRLEKQDRSIEVSGFSLRIGKPSATVNVAFQPQEFQKARIRRLPSGLWLVKFQGTRTWQPIQSDRLSVRGQMLKLGPKPTPYDLELVPRRMGAFDVISRMDLDAYLSGVVPSEMPAAWPLEALKAQTVAARSFAIRMAFERRDKDFDVDSTVFDQVYKFFSEIKEHPEWAEKINLAIKQTRDEVLVYNHRIVKAFYSADCGCQSEDPKFVWGKVDAFVSVRDPNCGKSAPTKWNLKLRRAEVREKLVAALDLPERAELEALQVAGRTPSGRVAKVVAAVDVEGKHKDLKMNSQEFRRIFGFDRVQSTDFQLHWLGEELQIDGRGVGHGVGLCQKGARTLADQGKGYREILKLYYPKARLISPRRT